MFSVIKYTSESNPLFFIILNNIIYGDKDDIRVGSDNNIDTPELIEIVGDDSITIKGFSPAVSRTMVVEYPYYSEYDISYRVPDQPLEGYVNAREQAQDWVIIKDSSPLLAPNETREILIAVDIPADVVIEEKNWEFWISVKGVKTSGIVSTELCSRWLVMMR